MSDQPSRELLSRLDDALTKFKAWGEPNVMPFGGQFPKTDAQVIAAIKRIEAGGCVRPPFGWRCTRSNGHEGPCAAVEDDGFQEGDYPTALRFRYTNHEGVTEDRTLFDVRLAFGHSDFHPEIEFDHFLIGKDAARDNAERHFPLSEMLQPPQDVGAFFAGVPRSGKWPGVRSRHLLENPACRACGKKKLLNVHHITPFHVRPELELEPTNLITLCETPSHNCHFMFGHGLDWRAYNPNVVEDAAAMLRIIMTRRYEETEA